MIKTAIGKYSFQSITDKGNNTVELE